MIDVVLVEFAIRVEEVWVVEVVKLHSGGADLVEVPVGCVSNATIAEIVAGMLYLSVSTS